MPLSLTRIEFLERLEERSKLLQLALAHVVEHMGNPVIKIRESDFYLDFGKGLEPIVYETILRMVEFIYSEQ